MLHNVPWFELVGRATETGSLRRSGSGDMEEKQRAALIYHPGPGVRGKEGEE